MTKTRITTATLLLLVGALIASVSLIQAAAKRTGQDAETVCLDTYNSCYTPGCTGKPDSCYSLCDTHYQQCIAASGVVFAKLKKHPQVAPPNPVLDKGTKKNQPTDLRPALKRMTRKEGSNVVHQGTGYALIAEIKGNRIVRWSALDNNGRDLTARVVVKGAECDVCVTEPKGDHFYQIDCADVATKSPKNSEKIEALAPTPRDRPRRAPTARTL